MRFLTGVAAGYLGAANKEMESNRKEKDEWRKLLFKHYTENVIPVYQKMKLTEMERANKAESYGALFGNKDLGNLAGNVGDPNIVSKLFDISGGPSGGQTVGLGGAEAAVGGGSSDDDGGASMMGQYIRNPNPELLELDKRYKAGALGAPVRPSGGLSGPDDYGQSKTPQRGLMSQPQGEENWWNKAMGTPNRAKIGEGVLNDIGSLYGVDPSEIRGMAASTLNPRVERNPVNADNLPRRRDSNVERRIAEMKNYKDDVRDPRAFQVSLNKYYETRDPKYLEEASSQIMNKEELYKLKEKYKKPSGGGGAYSPNKEATALALQGAKLAAAQKVTEAKTAKPNMSEEEAKRLYLDTLNLYMRKHNPMGFMVGGMFNQGTPGTNSTDEN